MKLRSLLGLIVAPLAVAACSLVFPVPDANDTGNGGGASGGGGGGGNGGGGAVDAGVLTCAQTGRGPRLVPAGDRLCIDSTPVTRAEYTAFLDAAVPLAPQIAGCEGNTSWTPLGPLGPADAGDVLVDGADWCDAWGFCAWAGKTLCGPFPGAGVVAGGAEPDGGFEHGLGQVGDTDRDASAMVWACEGGDAGNVYPYGNDLDSKQCYQPSFILQPQPVLGPVGATGCVGGFPGLVDMVGVLQWMDSCAGASCSLAGMQTCRGVTLGLPPALDPELFPMYDGLVAFRCCGVAPPTR